MSTVSDIVEKLPAGTDVRVKLHDGTELDATVGSETITRRDSDQRVEFGDVADVVIKKRTEGPE